MQRKKTNFLRTFLIKKLLAFSVKFSAFLLFFNFAPFSGESRFFCLVYRWCERPFPTAVEARSHFRVAFLDASTVQSRNRGIWIKKRNRDFGSRQDQHIRETDSGRLGLENRLSITRQPVVRLNVKATGCCGNLGSDLLPV